MYACTYMYMHRHIYVYIVPVLQFVPNNCILIFILSPYIPHCYNLVHQSLAHTTEYGR